MLCGLVKAGAIEARAYRQNETFDAALRFARTEGIIPAPEPAHAIRAVIDEAEQAREAGEARVILFGLCGHGHFDLARVRRLPRRRRWRTRSSPRPTWRRRIERLPEVPAPA